MSTNIPTITNGSAFTISDAKSPSLTAIDNAAGSTSMVLTPEQLRKVVESHNITDNKVLEMLNKRRGILSRLHPSDLDIVIENAKKEEFRQAVKQMLLINDCLNQTYIRQLRALCSANTKAVETTLSAYLTTHQANSYNALLLEMAKIKEQTAKCIDMESATIDNIKNPRFKELCLQHLDNVMHQTCEVYTTLINNYIKTLNSDGIKIEPNNY